MSTTITIPKELKEELERYKREKESWEDLLRRLAKGEHRRDIVVLPENIDIDIDSMIIEAIKEVKPPSKWSDLVKYIIVGVLGGLGLGVVLPW